MDEDIARRLRDLLAEATEYGEWSHEHCDEDAGGNHRLDRDALRSDSAEAIRRFDEANPETE